MLIKQIPNLRSFEDCLFQKPQPNLSIKLQQVQQKTKHTFTCKCQMCRQYDGKKIIEIIQQRTQNVNKKIKQKVQDNKIPTQYFLQILKKLVLPHHKIVKRGIDIYIPEICFFKDGQSKGIFMNRQLQDFNIKKIHKNAVNPGLIQRIFNERRRQYKEDIKKKLGISDRRPLTQQKQISPQKIKKQAPANIDVKDGVILKFTDGFQSMMPETQFIMMTLRRKQDPVWKTIQTIKNNISVQDQLKNIFFIKYQKTRIRFVNLLQRAKIISRIYAQNIIPGQSKYISAQQQNQFCLQLIKRDKTNFVEYVVYKIVTFIQYFYDQEIDKLSCKLLINQINRPYLLDVTKYKKRSLVKFTWTNQTYKKKLDQQESRIFIDRTIPVSEELEGKASTIQRLMEFKYTQMKGKQGISLQQTDNQEEKKNNQFFKKIHPQLNGLLLSQILTQDRNLTVSNFKKKYLGYRQEKKPLVKEFSTHMIRLIHKITPKLKVASFHEIPRRPNECGLLSSRRPNTCQLTKRRSWTAITSPSKNTSRIAQFQKAPINQRRQKSTESIPRRAVSGRTYIKSGCHLHASPV